MEVMRLNGVAVVELVVGTSLHGEIEKYFRGKRSCDLHDVT